MVRTAGPPLELDLSANNLGPADGTLLAEHLRRAGSSLARLALAGNPLTLNGVAALRQALRAPHEQSHTVAVLSACWSCAWWPLHAPANALARFVAQRRASALAIARPRPASPAPAQMQAFRPTDLA